MNDERCPECKAKLEELHDDDCSRNPNPWRDCFCQSGPAEDWQSIVCRCPEDGED